MVGRRSLMMVRILKKRKQRSVLDRWASASSIYPRIPPRGSITIMSPGRG